MNWNRMLSDPLRESYAAYLEKPWENERTATSIRAFAVRLHQTGYSLRETIMILAELVVKRLSWGGLELGTSAG